MHTTVHHYYTNKKKSKSNQFSNKYQVVIVRRKASLFQHQHILCKCLLNQIENEVPNSAHHTQLISSGVNKTIHLWEMSEISHHMASR